VFEKTGLKKQNKAASSYFDTKSYRAVDRGQYFYWEKMVNALARLIQI